MAHHTQTRLATWRCRRRGPPNGTGIYVSFHKMWTVWFRGAQISLPLRLRLYSAFVLPVLTYNMGTWGLTKTELNRLDAHHRRHLRQIATRKCYLTIIELAMYVSHVLDRKLLERLMSPSPKSQVMSASALS